MAALDQSWKGRVHVTARSMMNSCAGRVPIEEAGALEIDDELTVECHLPVTLA